MHPDIKKIMGSEDNGVRSCKYNIFKYSYHKYDTARLDPSFYCIRSCGNEARLKIIDRINKIPEPAEIPAVEVYSQAAAGE